MSVLRDFHGLPREVFIETGTGEGVTLLSAWEAGFGVCHSIEIERKTFEYNAERFKGFPNLYIHNGPSPDVLPEIIYPHLATTFWLDAHYSGGHQPWYDDDGYRRPQCPVLDELAVIAQFEWDVPVTVLVDDAFMYEEPFWQAMRGPFREGDWPRKELLLKVMEGWEVSRPSVEVLRFDAS